MRLKETSLARTSARPIRKLVRLKEPSFGRTLPSPIRKSVRLKECLKLVHTLNATTETVRLLEYSKSAHISTAQTLNRTSSLQVSMFPPTVGLRPNVVYGVIHLSPYISYHFYLIN